MVCYHLCKKKKKGLKGYVDICLEMPRISLDDLTRNLSGGCC